MPKAKVYYIPSPYETCDYVRCYMPALYCGYNGSKTSLYAKTKSNEQVAKEINDSDIIVFHRADTIAHHKAAIACKNAGKLVIFDNDDTAYLDRGHPFDPLNTEDLWEKAPMYRNLIDNFILNADAVTTTTEFLAKEYRINNKNVKVIPNCVDPKDWGIPKRNEGDKVRILISGSAAYTKDFEHIKDYLIELDKRDDVQLIMFGLWGKKKRADNPMVERVYVKEFAFWDSLPNLEHIQWCDIQDYPRVLNEIRADIQIIPRFESYFNKCKSNLKFLEASMCEVPCVLQTFTTKDSPYDELPDDTCLKAGNVLEWRSQIEKLIADKELRRNIGMLAKKYVLENFNIQKNHTQWSQFYDSIFNNSKKN